MTKIVQSRPAEPGEEHSYRLEPPPEPGATITWKINGVVVTVHSKEAGLLVERVAYAEMGVQVVGDVAAGTIVEANIRYPGGGSESVLLKIDAGTANPDVIIFDQPGGAKEPPRPTPGGEWTPGKKLWGCCPPKVDFEGHSYVCTNDECRTTGLWPIFYGVECTYVRADAPSDPKPTPRTFTWWLAIGIVVARP